MDKMIFDLQRFDVIDNYDSSESAKLYGSAGNDVINIYGSNNVTVNCGAGNDTITIYNYNPKNDGKYSQVSSITVEDFSDGDVIHIMSDTTLLEVTDITPNETGIEATYTEGGETKNIQINFVKTSFTSENNNSWTYKTTQVKGGASKNAIGQIVFANNGIDGDATSHFTLSGLKSGVKADQLKAGILYYKNTAIINDSSILDQSSTVTISEDYTLQLSNAVSPSETWKPDSNNKTKYAYISSDDNAGYHVKEDNKVVYTSTPKNTFELTGLKEGLTVDAIRSAVSVTDHKQVNINSEDILDKKNVSLSGG